MSQTIARTLDDIATEVRGTLQRMNNRQGDQFEDAIAIGLCCLEARRQMPSDKAFGAWRQRELPALASYTAYDYRRLAVDPERARAERKLLEAPVTFINATGEEVSKTAPLPQALTKVVARRMPMEPERVQAELEAKPLGSHGLSPDQIEEMALREWFRQKDLRQAKLLELGMNPDPTGVVEAAADFKRLAAKRKAQIDGKAVAATLKDWQAIEFQYKSFLSTATAIKTKFSPEGRAFLVHKIEAAIADLTTFTNTFEETK